METRNLFSTGHDAEDCQNAHDVFGSMESMQVSCELHALDLPTAFGLEVNYIIMQSSPHSSPQKKRVVAGVYARWA